MFAAEAPTPKRLVVMFHGNESSLDELHATRALDTFSNTETVLALTYPGYPHAREPRGSAAQRDNDVIDYLLPPLRTAAASFDEVWLFGHSLGAAVVLALCKQFRPTGAALISPFSSLKDAVHNPIYKFAIGERWNSLANVQALHTKCYICHGLLDNVVPATQSSALLAKCNAPRKRRFVLPYMNHALSASIMRQIVQDWQVFAGQPRAKLTGCCVVDAH